MSIKSVKKRVISALGFLIVSFWVIGPGNAAIIQNVNPDISVDAFNGDCGVPGELIACVGGWNLDNVDITLKYADGLDFGSFDKESGMYTIMNYGDYFESIVRGTEEQAIAIITGKTWPVGEPNALKAVNNDTLVSHGKPQNCIIGTAFLSPENSEIEDANFLDSIHPQPVICSSPFQTHKRFKVAMMPAAVMGVESGEGHGIDLVFNVTDTEDDALRPYQVFSKINNYTGKRLSGYKLVVGVGTGNDFLSASELGIAQILHLSLGRGEGASGGHSTLTFDGSDIFEDDSMATFSHGLFGAPDKHFSSNGFFDERKAGYMVVRQCVSDDIERCPSYDNPLIDDPLIEGNTLLAQDVIMSTTTFDSNYHQLNDAKNGLPFGDWLPSKWQPKAIFFDDDGDPETDATIVAWWDGSNWRGKYDDDFEVMDQGYIDWLADHPDGLYELGEIEDVLNLGVNYIIKVADGIGGKFTLRIIPIVSENQAAPVWCDEGYGYCSEPPFGSIVADGAVVAEEEEATVEDDDIADEADEGTADESDSGGGCSLSDNGRIDPTLLILFALSLIYVGWREAIGRRKSI